MNDLDKLKELIAAGDKYAGVKCPPAGPLDAKIAFVGEAPGQKEAQTGIPFHPKAPAGGLFTDILITSGISRSDIYITNVIKEKPPNNNISTFISFKKDSAYPTERYIEYEDQLAEELSKCSANVIVALGAVASFALLRRTGITKIRGSIYPATEKFGRRKVIPTIHPSAANRMYIYRYFITADIRKAIHESASPDITYTKRNIRILKDATQVISHLTTLLKTTNLIAFDIEVVNYQVSCLSIATSATDVVVIPFEQAGEHIFTTQEEADIWLLLKRLLENPNIVKLGQNIKFDAWFLYIRYGIIMHPLEDTMIASAIATPEFPKGLDFLCSVYSTEPYYKDEGKLHRSVGGDYQSWWEYNAKDSAVLFEIMPKLKAMLRQQSNTHIYDTTIKIIHPLLFMEARGFRMDVAAMTRKKQETKAKIQELQSSLDAIVGHPLNVNSAKQMKAYFYSELKQRPYIYRGKPTCDEKALKRMRAKGIIQAGLCIEIRQLRKLLSSYLDIRLSNGRLTGTYNPVGTVTGRLSSGQNIFGEGINLQTIPPELEQFIQADPGCLMINQDLSQAENRIIAYYTPVPNLVHAFESKIDVHRLTASLIFNKPIEQISDEPGSAAIGGGRFSERYWGKRCNHAFNYDMGPREAATKLEITEQEARFLLARYHNAYPEIRDVYHRRIRTMLTSNNRQLTNLFGRTRRFVGRLSEIYKAAYDYIPQSTVADKINLQGMVEIYYNSECRPAELLLQKHDSITYQINVIKHGFEQAARIILHMKQSLETPLQCHGRTFTIPVDTKVGTTLANGRSIPDVESVGRLAKWLHEIYGELRTSTPVQPMVRDLNYSRLPETQSETKMGKVDLLP